MLSKIGPYPLEREVGRGGMGIVYLGRDPRLNRPVAIKVLPEGFAHDTERLARFEREARMLAALTHPNIAGIYGLEEADGKRFLALEYVEGETLAEILDRGPLPLDEALDVCIQIAAAVEAAHEAGIIHRDLKPGNVKLTPSGVVKVLDFGLAKGSAPGADSAPDLTRSPTMTQAATSAGVILGTAAYMSPEQARGKPVDRRTDIWSFGCVLYECLTGQQAFAGETVSDMIALILQGEADASKLPPNTPERVRELLARCLDKDPRRRLRDIGEARLELERSRARASESGRLSAAAVASAALAPAAAPRAPRWRAPAVVAALIGLGATAGILAWQLAGLGSRPPATMRFSIAAPPGYDLNPDPNELAISPDGRTLVFSLVDSTGQSSLWSRPLDSFDAQPIAGTRSADLPFWSPDSRQIGFFAEGKLKRTRVAAGNPEIVCDATSGRGATWNRNDVIVFAPSPAGPLMKVRAAGGTPEAVTQLDPGLGETAHRWPSFLPDGEHFTYVALPSRNGGFPSYVGSLGSRQRQALFSSDTAPIFAPPGHLIFTRNEALLAQRFDVGGLKLVGDPFTVGTPPSTATTFSGSPGASVSRDGVLAWLGAGTLQMRLQWFDRDGRVIGNVGVPVDRWALTTISHDGTRATLEQDLSSGNTDLWVADLVRGTINRLTYGQGKNTAALWSPDDKEIVFSSTREGIRNLYRRASDGSGQDRLFYKSEVTFKDATSWSPDGKWVLISQIAAKNGWDILEVPAGGGDAVPLIATPFNEQGSGISPDGHWLLYFSDESGTTQGYVQRFPELGSRQQVTRTGGFYGFWCDGGREIIVLKSDFSIESVPVTPGPEFQVGVPHTLFRLPGNARGAWPSPDGKRFLVTVPAVQVTPAISVAVNWRSAAIR